MFGTLDRTSPAVVGVLSPTANTIQKGVEMPYVYIANGKMNPLGDIPEEIEKVCNEYPNLTGHGLKKYKEDSVHQPPNPNGVQLCMRWLLENDGFKRRITINTNIILPKNVSKRETKKDGIKYNTNHKNIKIVSKPIIIVLFSSFANSLNFFDNDIFIINNYKII